MTGSGKRDPVSARVLVYALCGLAVLAGGIAFALRKSSSGERSSYMRREVVEQKPSPSLHCLFSDFTHASVVVGFDFAVTLAKGSAARFDERAEAVRNDPPVNFDAGSRPTWSYTVDDDGIQTIASPDGATRILLYGLKLGSGGVFWTEAGIRSNTFRNLDGKCLQSHLENVD